MIQTYNKFWTCLHIQLGSVKCGIIIIIFYISHKSGIKYFLKLLLTNVLRALVTESLKDHYPKTKNEVTNSFESVSCIYFVILKNITHTHKKEKKKEKKRKKKEKRSKKGK